MGDKANEMIQDLKKRSLELLDRIDVKVDQLNNPIFISIRENSGLRPSVVVLAGCLLLILFTLYGIGARAFTNLVGFVYPIYKSFWAIKSPATDDDTYWLTYWVFYGFFATGESLGDNVFSWVPLYHLVKLCLLVWAYAPQTKGAQLLFKLAIEPFLSKHESIIDKTMKKSIDAAGEINRKVLKPTLSEFADSAMDVTAKKIASTFSGNGGSTAPREGSSN